MNDRFLSNLGLARRAQKILYGFESVVENMAHVSTVFIATDSSQRTKKNIELSASDYNIGCVYPNYTKSDFGYALGTKPVGVIAVTDNGFAKLLLENLSEGVTK